MSTRERGESIVKSHVIWSMGAGLIPIPFVDAAAITLVEIDMLKQLCAIYGKDFQESAGKSYISALTGTYLARLGAQAVKAIPVIGSLIGGVSMSILAGATTYAVGTVFIHHFETGGSLFDFDAEKFKSFFRDQFEKGKSVAEDLKKKQEQNKNTSTANSDAQQEKASDTQAPPSSKTDPIAKLRELNELKEKGIISDEDFEKMKKKILEEI